MIASVTLKLFIETNKTSNMMIASVTLTRAGTSNCRKGLRALECHTSNV
jgi:hypothetical protein